MIREPMPDQVQISVVIPCYNCDSTIRQCLEAVMATGSSDLEVILVDDASTDHTAEIVASFPVKYVRNEANRGPSYCRNIGVTHAQGQIVFLIDSDVLIPRDSFDRIRRFFQEHPDVHVLQGRYSDRSYHGDVISKYKNYKLAFRELSRPGSEVAFINTSIVALRRSVFSKYSFDEQLRRAEDSLFGWKYYQDGNKILLDKEFQAVHMKKHTLRSFIRYQFRSGRDLVSNWIYKDMSKAILSGTNSRSNRLQLLRAPVSLALVAALILSVWLPRPLSMMLIAALLLLSIFLQIDFLSYVWKVDGPLMAAAAVFIYLLDGFVSGLGVLAGFARALAGKRVFQIRSGSVP